MPQLMRVQRERQILDNAFPQPPEAYAGYDSTIYAWHNMQTQVWGRSQNFLKRLGDWDNPVGGFCLQLLHWA